MADEEIKDIQEEKKEEKVEEKVEEKKEEKVEEKVEEKKEEEKEKAEEKKEEKEEADADKEKEEEKIVEKKPNEFHSEWTFWFDKKISNKKAPSDKFEDALVSLGSFTTINDFWQLYTHITKPEDLQKSCNLRLFRNDVRPTWENYSGGGFWIVRFARSSNALNRIWEELVFALVGERFEDDGVVGVVLSLRKQEDYLSIWLKDNGIRFRVGEKLKQVLNLDGSSHIEYKFISHSLRDRSTCRNSKSYALPQ